MSEVILNLLPLVEGEKEEFEAIAPDAEHIYTGRRKVTPEEIDRATVIIGWPRARDVANAKNLKWFQTMWAGSDEYLDFMPEGATLTSSTGSNRRSVAEHMFACTLSLCRRLPAYRDSQRAHVWEDEGAMKTLLDEGAEAFVFDVRNNPGGAVDSVNEMLDYLLPEGDLMGLASKAGKEEQYTSDKKCLELPMAVLVDAESISAAEFFAACLQEYDWATVVGEQTIGKGYSQRMYSLMDGSAVRISDKMYFMPSGKSLIGTGIMPDIVVELPDEKEPDFYFLSPAEDDQLSAALQTLR